MEETISLKEIFSVVRKRMMLIILCTIGAALIAAIVSFFMLTPVYESNTQFIVNQSGQENGEELQIDSNQIRTNVELINTYNVIIKSNAILSEVIDELGLNYSTDTLTDKVQVSSEQDSQVVNVTVKDPDPAMATAIANTTVHIFQNQIPEIMNVDNVSILSEAETEADPMPVEPKPTLNIAIALALGLMVGVGIAFLLEYLDTTIRTEKDVEEKLGATVIGVISSMEAEDMKQDRTVAVPTRKGGKTYVQS